MTAANIHEIAATYRWHRGLGYGGTQLANARIVVDLQHPSMWDANAADSVTAETDDEIDRVLGAMETPCAWRLARRPHRSVHTDPFTPAPFVARLALDGFEERAVVIQTALHGGVAAGPATILYPVEHDAGWTMLARLVARDYEEGLRTFGTAVSAEVIDGIVAGYRAKAHSCPFYVAKTGGEAVAYSSFARARNGVGIIEDLFTLPQYRRRGIVSGMIAAFADRLRRDGVSRRACQPASPAPPCPPRISPGHPNTHLGLAGAIAA